MGVPIQAVCTQLKCAGHVRPAEGRFFGYGRCGRCGVVLLRVGKRWRILTSKEWERAPKDLASLHVWSARARRPVDPSTSGE
jgi:hypothetical protein